MEAVSEITEDSEETKIQLPENRTEGEEKAEETADSEPDLQEINFHILYLSGVRADFYDLLFFIFIIKKLMLKFNIFYEVCVLTFILTNNQKDV